MDSPRKIYLISAEINGVICHKIGYTKREVETRIKEFKTGNCSDFEILYVYTPEKHPVSIEGALHKHFQLKKIDGEWFELSQEDIEEFPSLCEKFYDQFHLISSTNTYITDNNITFK
ncbi:MAG: hypothetical protein SLAVMIC_00869 [uncultured marine phage]|uniref:Bacteriophage T5 Orf172 DNA-binding domain-containing protein n=1 Tax=uncultured marine phage TaxID=707152 RepID=A0A8D9FRW7_9VIRU|nr:MAG: hypothetical protein SLAVMIC_00869 [uncultured marine phage]